MEMLNKFCTQCGASLKERAKFCGSCGAPTGVVEVESPVAGQHPSQPPMPPIPPQPPTNVPGQQTPVPPAYSTPPLPGQMSTGYAPQQRMGHTPADFAPQQSYPQGTYGYGAGPMGQMPQATRGGSGKFLLMLFVFLALAGGAVWYLGASGTIDLPWSTAPNTKQYIGRWQAVSRTIGSKTTDVTKEKEKLYLDIAKGEKDSLTGKMSVSGETGDQAQLELKPVKGQKKYEGTAKNPRDAKQVLSINLEYFADSQELVLTAFMESEVTTVRFKKI